MVSDSTIRANLIKTDFILSLRTNTCLKSCKLSSSILSADTIISPPNKKAAAVRTIFFGILVTILATGTGLSSKRFGFSSPVFGSVSNSVSEYTATFLGSRKPTEVLRRWRPPLYSSKYSFGSLSSMVSTHKSLTIREKSSLLNISDIPGIYFSLKI